jgi:hypothetical protein
MSIDHPISELEARILRAMWSVETECGRGKSVVTLRYAMLLCRRMFPGTMQSHFAKHYRTCPRRKKQVVCIDCRPRQNGKASAANKPWMAVP